MMMVTATVPVEVPIELRSTTFTSRSAFAVRATTHIKKNRRRNARAADFYSMKCCVELLSYRSRL